jgi:predicted amidohydrolase YtcJ
VVLSKNLLTVDYREIPSAEVEMTFVGGELKYQK